MKVSAKSNTRVHEVITTLMYDLEESIDIDKPNIIDLICGYLEKTALNSIFAVSQNLTH